MFITNISFPASFTFFTKASFTFVAIEHIFWEALTTTVLVAL